MSQDYDDLREAVFTRDRADDADIASKKSILSRLIGDKIQHKGDNKYKKECLTVSPTTPSKPRVNKFVKLLFLASIATVFFYLLNQPFLRTRLNFFSNAYINDAVVGGMFFALQVLILMVK